MSKVFTRGLAGPHTGRIVRGGGGRKPPRNRAWRTAKRLMFARRAGRG